MSWYTFVCCFG